MNIDPEHVVTFVVSVAGIISSVAYTISRLAKIELKVETMWAFQLRRGFGEAIDKGMATKNSPLKITQKAKDLFAPLKNDLQRFFLKFGIRQTDTELAMSIERYFGEQIVDLVCIPAGLSDAACLVIATAVAKNEDTINIATHPTIG